MSDFGLKNYGFRVFPALKASDGLMLARETNPDIIITDALMPDISGFELCKIVKTDPALSGAAVIMISGEKIDENNILEGYRKGADDYIIKPFSYNILLAKIQVVLRRYSQSRSKSVTKFGLKINPSQREVTKNGRPLKLTRKEFDLLLLLLSRENQVLSAAYILDTVWGYDPAVYNDPHTIEVHVSRLRKKLGGDFSKRIKKITGVGYKFASR